MAEQGWLALEIPEDEGGLGMGLVEIAVLCEEIGRRLAAVPFLSSVVALGALNEPDVRSVGWTKEWREALSQGEAVACVARAGGADITAEPSDETATMPCCSAAPPRPPPTRPRPTWS